jgi:DEAD/DEAH box helicase domain-containing protein
MTLSANDMNNSLAALWARLQQNKTWREQVVAWENLPARPAQFAPWPPGLDGRVTAVYATAQAIHQPYTHQAEAITAVLNGANVILATTTASGKSLAYTAPALHKLLGKGHGRVLYLFPTKALAQDQLAITQQLIQAGNLPLHAHTYDGDTPQSQRRKIRQTPGIIISNPDMLHVGILPYHTQWRDFFRHLDLIVIDEIHTYRGVFGSHVANVLRRLQRICHFYGSAPQLIACSATIANPRQHAERLTGQPFTLIDETANGAPRGPKQFIMLNPPLIDATLGLRQSTLILAKELAAQLIQAGVQTALFARTRQTVELLLTYLQDELIYQGGNPEQVAGYRGGYLPLERRRIESGLRTGELRGVVATNALELGVDIGELDAVLLLGYPGSIASVWQQAGRAGRRAGESTAVFIASNTPLDQYIARHPHYILHNNPEHALINPDNLRLMVPHLACAAFELPFTPDETYGHTHHLPDLLQALQEMGLLYQTSTQYHYLSPNQESQPPATRISLRTSGTDRIIIQAYQANSTPLVIGELDRDSAPHTLHEGAIYLHQAQSYLVEQLDWEGGIAYVRPISADYYTRATVASEIQRFSPTTEEEVGEIYRAYGDVLVISRATSYRKIKRYSHETLGYGEINLPEMALDTQGYWLVFSQTLTEQLYDAGILLRPNDYGPNWQSQRQLALNRDNHTCRLCGATRAETILHVHHIHPFREFGYVRGENQHYLQANQVENLLTLCPSCHRLAEQGQQARSALGGLAYVWGNLAPLFLMCDPQDIAVTAESLHPLTQRPTLVIYERVPAGVGFSEQLFQVHNELLTAASDLIATCPCQDGCPACVGPPGEIGPDTKQITLDLLRLLRS